MTQRHFTVDERVEIIRNFNRKYIQRLGAFSERVFGSSYSLTEMKILHDLSQSEDITATELSKTMRLDGGYISRILAGFQKAGLITRTRSVKDGRMRKITLTPKGRKAWEQASRHAHVHVLELMEPLDESQQLNLVSAMRTISVLLSFEPPF